MRRFLVAVTVVAAALLLVPVAWAETDPAAADPPFSIDPELVAETAVECVEPATPAAPDADAVLLVHGTGTTGHQQYGWNYELRLAEEGLPYCVVNYPDRGYGDMQVSAEYVVVAVHEAAKISPSGRVDMVGHSQGASMPRWAIRYWPSVQALLDDFVMLAGFHHGTVVADVGDPFTPLFGLGGGMPPAIWQFQTDSEFNRYVNAGDETPGNVDYSNLYTYTDELVQPSGPSGAGSSATGALEVDDPSKVVNINVQDVCPLRPVDHLSIGTTDRFTMELTVAALRSPGPADVSSLDTTLCSLPDQYLVPETLPAMFEHGWDTSGGSSWFDPDAYVAEEPPVRDYATEEPAAG